MMKIRIKKIAKEVKENMQKLPFPYLSIGLLLFFPVITLAAPANFKDIVLIVVEILTAILPVIVTLTFIYFIWGLTKYLKSEDTKKDDAKGIMIRGIIVFFVMSSIWGLVRILTKTFIEPGGTNTPSSLDITDNNWSATTPVLKSPLE